MCFVARRSKRILLAFYLEGKSLTLRRVGYRGDLCAYYLSYHDCRNSQELRQRRTWEQQMLLRNWMLMLPLPTVPLPQNRRWDLLSSWYRMVYEYLIKHPVTAWVVRASRELFNWFGVKCIVFGLFQLQLVDLNLGFMEFMKNGLMRSSTLHLTSRLK